MQSSSYTSSPRDRLLEGLNPAQRQAVTHPAGPLLVVAGAGTGKTRVLTRRVAWLVGGGIPAASVLAITFTNKSADVLKQRLADLPHGAGAWAGTFHGFGAFLLRRHADAIGLDPRFTIIDRDDQLRLLKTLITDLGLRDQGLRPADVSSHLSHVKNGAGGRAPSAAAGADASAHLEQIEKAYEERLRASSLFDFDDLLTQSVRLLREAAWVRDLYRDRFAHVLVDEFQDTNRVQRDLLLELVGPTEEGTASITAVGDPDQSIYRWRGAAVRNILEFGDDFPGAETVLMEQNYRSTQNILAAAENVIAQNRERHAKRLFTERDVGSRVSVVRCRDGEDEAEAVAGQIQAWRHGGTPLADIAVFYRVNALSRGLELALRGRRIPYVVVAGVEFFQRREVKDVLCYARLVENPRDDSAFLRVANVPKRGVGEASLKKLRAFASARGISCREAARSNDSGVSGRARNGLRRLETILHKLETFPRTPVAPLLDAIVVETGYRANLEDNPDEIERNRVENVNELIAYARRFDRTDPDGNLRAFLERAALVSDQDAYEGDDAGAAREPDAGRVSLMSVHAAKGLEFPKVIVIGCELGYFPHGRSLDEAGLEEERRLFYVAMTRAKDQLVLTHAARRFTYMGEERRGPSPYLRALPEHAIENEDRLSHHGPVFDLDRQEPDPTDVVREVAAPFAAGERVLHPYFGEGWLRSSQGRGAEARVTVDFDAFGRKQLLLRHARLERAE